MNLKIGCCGFPVSRKKYYEKFKTIELQQTFYSPPGLKTVKSWRDSAPAGFEFTLKALQVITHESKSPTYRKMKVKTDRARKENFGSFKPTDEVYRAWEKTDRIAAVLRAKTIVFQCPPSFGPNRVNRNNLRKFFRTIKRKKYRLVWEPRGAWQNNEVRRLCGELGLVHCVDPFAGGALEGDIRYFRLHGIGGYRYRYKGWDLKRLRDFCENEAKKIKKKPVYVFFNNFSMMTDALRFKWIVKNTGRIQELDLVFLKDLCHEIDAEEEDEKVQKLSREAERIVSLILHTDYAKVDIEIEKTKLQELCRKMFPDKAYLYDMIYGQRFDRLWKQFRGKKEKL
ncbi:MAG: DUF72 domain-containing protein [Candidatus Omnitrophota bacterium]|nr:DUF72 domain-containing protein [Candidatus Omnitrophota bacterium]